MADPLRIAFVGGGNMTREHIRAFGAQPGVELAGITNRTTERAEALAVEFGIGKVCDDIPTLFNTTRADIVVMAVYEPAIFETVSILMEYPWTILMEKPMGVNLQQAEQISQKADATEAKLYVGLNRRSMSSTLSAHTDLSNCAETRFIHVQDQQSLETARKVGHTELVVQNWMYANSVHLVDYLMHFGRGDIVDINVLERWTPDDPRRVIAHMRFESGDSAIYEAHWNAPGPWACTITTPNKRWELRPLENAQFQNAGERTLHDVEQYDVDREFKPGFFKQAENICAVARGANVAGAVAYDNALKTMNLVASIYATD